jgi:hypothetical protein
MMMMLIVGTWNLFEKIGEKKKKIVGIYLRIYRDKYYFFLGEN